VYYGDPRDPITRLHSKSAAGDSRLPWPGGLRAGAAGGYIQTESSSGVTVVSSCRRCRGASGPALAAPASPQGETGGRFLSAAPTRGSQTYPRSVLGRRPARPGPIPKRGEHGEAMAPPTDASGSADVARCTPHRQYMLQRGEMIAPPHVRTGSNQCREVLPRSLIHAYPSPEDDPGAGRDPHPSALCGTRVLLPARSNRRHHPP
jgi:hypothetical protein